MEAVLTAAEPQSSGALIAKGSSFVICPQRTLPGHAEAAQVIKHATPALAHSEIFVERLRSIRDRLLALQHPHAERVTTVWAELGDCWLLCERLDGESLAQILERGGRLSLEDARAVCQQICEVLDAAHALGLAHGNLSPERVIFLRPIGEGTPTIKVRAFGLGLPLADGLFGIPPYLAPEQVDPFSPQPEPTPKSDQFALAALLAEMLTGCRAFSGETVDDVRGKLLREDPRQVEWAGANPEDARRVRKVLERALSKQPALRYERLRDFVAALRPRSPALLVDVSRLHPMPLQLNVNASVLFQINDIPTLKPQHGVASTDETQPALRTPQISVLCDPSMRPVVEVRPCEPHTTLKSLRSEAETTRSPPVHVPPLSVSLVQQPRPLLPRLAAPSPPLLGGMLRLGRSLATACRRRTGVLLGVAMGFALMGVLSATWKRRSDRPQVSAPPPSSSVAGQAQPTLQPVHEPPVLDPRRRPHGVKSFPPKRRPMSEGCTVTEVTGEFLRALQTCFRPLHRRSFTIRLDRSGNPSFDDLPPKLIDSSLLTCLYAARGTPQSLRAERLRKGLRVTCH